MPLTKPALDPRSVTVLDLMRSPPHARGRFTRRDGTDY
jgi:hypothetical protein